VRLLKQAVGNELHAVHRYMHFHLHLFEIWFFVKTQWLPSEGGDFNAYESGTSICRFGGSHVADGAIEPCFCSG